MVLPAEQVSDSELDEQQAQLLDVLRRFGGKPVSYQQLRDAGIEYPASVVSELELAGLPLERAYEGTLSARRLLGVRLDPRYERADAEPQKSAAPETRVVAELRSSIRGAALLASAEASCREALRALAGLVARAEGAARPRVSRAARSIAKACGTAGARGGRALGRALTSLRPAPGSAPTLRLLPPVPVRVRAPRAPRAPMRGGGEAPWRWLAPAALITAAALVAAIVGGGGAGTQPHRSPSAHQPRLRAGKAAPSASSPAGAPQRRVPAR